MGESETAATEERARPGDPLRAGDDVLIVDPKGREYLRQLRPGKRYSLHAGMVDADALIGRPDGLRVQSSLGQPFLVYRPTYARLIPNLPRQAQVIYPKDAATILIWGDIYPGARVIEAGVGPGALTIALLRAIGPRGQLVSIERREDHVTMARETVARHHGDAPNWRTVLGEAAEVLPGEHADRVILDLPDPAPVVPAAATALRPGGVLACWVPTTLQLAQLGAALRDEARFAAVQTFE